MRLGYDPFDDRAPAIVTATVARSQIYEGVVQFRDEHGRAYGKKELTSSADDCTELASAMALTISIVLDPRAAMGETERKDVPPPPPSHDSPFEEERPVRAEPSPPSAPPAAEPVFVRVGAEGLAAVGAAPATAAGIAAFVGIGRGKLSLDLEARADFPASLTRGDGTGVSSSLLVANLAPCGHLAIAMFCALASAGALHGEGLNVGAPDRKVTFYAAAGARAGLELPLTRAVFARVHADVLLPMTRTTLRSRGVEYWTTSPISGVLALGLFARF
ncbi:MAG: hypothetical protein K0S65_2084 [Labilithrix sp.]|nr:hypothetical protein [Labilithrix sp.]